jgi:putative tryptophan/tyrosine transport system substrate-binding protein
VKAVQSLILCLAIVVLVSVPTIVEAQQARKVYRIGYLPSRSGSPAPNSRYIALLQGLRDLGYVEGQNLVVEYRSAEGDTKRLPDLAAELVKLKVDVIVALGPTARSLKSVTHIPVVFATSADPVAAGLTRSLARPSRNMTGVTFMSFEINGKRLELLKEAFPDISRVAILSNPTHPGEPLEIEESRSAAKGLGLHIDYFPVRSVADTTAALAAIRAARDQAIIGIPDGLLRRHGARIGEFAVQERIPLVYGWRNWVQWGALMTFGPDLDEATRDLPRYVDRLLRGAKPADLPIERPKRFELVINLKTARQLGITIPPSVLYQASEVIK